MRVSNQSMSDSMVALIQQRYASLQTAQHQVSTGLRLTRPSDGPADMESVMTLRAFARAREQQTRAAGDAHSWIQSGDAQLQTASTVLIRARELAIRAASVTTGPERDAIATEMDGIVDELASIGNAAHGGVALFGGTAAGTVVTKGGGGWQYDGTATPIERRIGDDDVVQVAVTAQDLFGLGAPGDTLTTIEDLAAAVRAGDNAGINAGIIGLDTAAGRISDAQATIGAAGARVERAADRLQLDSQTITQQISEIRDIPAEEAVMELQLQQTGYEATLGALSHVLLPSLADFLR